MAIIRGHEFGMVGENAVIDRAAEDHRPRRQTFAFAVAISSIRKSPASTWTRSAATSRARARSPAVLGSSIAVLKVRVSAARDLAGIVPESSSGGIERSPTGAFGAITSSSIPPFTPVRFSSVAPPTIRFPAPPPVSGSYRSRFDAHGGVLRNSHRGRGGMLTPQTPR